MPTLLRVPETRSFATYGSELSWWRLTTSITTPPVLSRPRAQKAYVRKCPLSLGSTARTPVLGRKRETES